MTPEDAMQLVDWRRQNAALYARVREQADPAAAHALWRDGRDEMMRSHPQSPLPADSPLRASGVPYWPYDPALRWALPVKDYPIRSIGIAGGIILSSMVFISKCALLFVPA